MTPEVSADISAPDITSQDRPDAREKQGCADLGHLYHGVNPSHHGHTQLPAPLPSTETAPLPPLPALQDRPSQLDTQPVRPSRGRRPTEWPAQRPGGGRHPAPHGLVTLAAPPHSLVDAENLKASQLLEDSDLEPLDPKSKLRNSREENKRVKGRGATEDLWLRDRAQVNHRSEKQRRV